MCVFLLKNLYLYNGLSDLCETCVQLNYIICLRDDVRAATIVHFSYGNLPTKIIKFLFKINITKYFFFYLLLLCKPVCSNASKWYFLLQVEKIALSARLTDQCFYCLGQSCFKPITLMFYSIGLCPRNLLTLPIQLTWTKTLLPPRNIPT